MTGSVATLSGNARRFVSGGNARRFAVAALITFGCLLAVSSVFVGQLRDLVLDTDEWVATLGPLPQDEDVSAALSVFLVDELFEAADTATNVEEAFPLGARLLARPISAKVERAAAEAAQQVIETDAFRAVWDAGNRVAHTAFVEVVSGDPSELELTRPDGEEITIDLEDALSQVTAAMGEAGEALGAEGALEGRGEIRIVRQEQLNETRDAVNALEKLNVVLPILTIALFVSALGLSTRRRNTTIAIGASLAVTGLVGFIALKSSRDGVLDLIADPLNRAAAGAAWDQLTKGLRDQLLFVILIFGTLLALGAYLSGPFGPAVRFRRAVGLDGRTPEWLSGASEQVGGFLDGHATAVRIIAVAAALAALALWPALSWPTVIGALAVLGVAYAIIELLTPGERQSPSTSADNLPAG